MFIQQWTCSKLTRCSKCCFIRHWWRENFFFLAKRSAASPPPPSVSNTSQKYCKWTHIVLQNTIRTHTVYTFCVPHNTWLSARLTFLRLYDESLWAALAWRIWSRIFSRSEKRWELHSVYRWWIKIKGSWTSQNFSWFCVTTFWKTAVQHTFSQLYCNRQFIVNAFVIRWVWNVGQLRPVLIERIGRT
jgi:hypothetical protein